MNAASNRIIGTALAEADENVQAEVLNDFVGHLRVACKVGHGSAGTQGHYIAQHLKRDTVEFLREMIGSYDYAQENVQQELVDARAQLDTVRELIRLERDK